MRFTSTFLLAGVYGSGWQSLSEFELVGAHEVQVALACYEDLLAFVGTDEGAFVITACTPACVVALRERQGGSMTFYPSLLPQRHVWRRSGILFLIGVVLLEDSAHDYSSSMLLITPSRNTFSL